MKTPPTKVTPVVHSRYPSFGRRMLGLFLLTDQVNLNKRSSTPLFGEMKPAAEVMISALYSPNDLRKEFAKLSTSERKSLPMFLITAGLTFELDNG